MLNLNLRRLILAAACCVFMLLATSGQTQARVEVQHPQTASAEPKVDLLTDGLELTWHLPEISQNESVLEIVGFQLSQIPGRPMLPSRSVGVALPIHGNPVLTVTTLGETEQIQLEKPIPLAPAPDGVERNAAGDVIGGAFSPAELDPAYQPEWATFEEIGTMAGVRLGRITLHPILPVANGRYQFVRDITIQLDFQVDAPTTRHVQGSAMVETIAETVINESQIAPENVTRNLSELSQMANFPTAIIETDGKAGMIQISHAELLAAGFPVNDSNLEQFHLYRGESEIAWRLIGSGARNDRLEAAESLIFYAPGEHSRWTVNEAFRLVAEDSPGRQMQNGSASPAGLPLASHTVTVTVEKDLVYTPQCLCGSQPLARDGDRWMWEELKRPGAESAEFEIETPHFSTTDTAELTVWLMGLTDLNNLVDDHLLSVHLNGTELGQVVWGGKTNKQAKLTIPAGVLQAVNTTTITLEETGGLFDGVWVDAFEIRYVPDSSLPLVNEQLAFSGNSARSQYAVPVSQIVDLTLYDLTDPASPVNLLGFSASSNRLIFGDLSAGPRDYAMVQDGGYHAPQRVRLAQSLLTSGVTGATYIIVTPAEFVGELNGLFALRSSQGYSVVIEEVERIYDQFGNGEPNPAAIQAYLKNAWTTWSPQPKMVLLAGDGHYDARQNFDGSPVIQIPPFLIDTDPWMGETAADNRFVTFDGPDDQLPEMGIGRLPVNSVAELQTVLQKIETYDSAELGEWAGKITVISDDTDEAGDFGNHSDKLIRDYFPRPWKTSRYYLSLSQEDGGVLLDPIKNSWNDGNGLVMFTGHSSIHQWAAERLFHIDEVPSLEHSGELPVVMGMSCFTSSFHYPEADVIDEDLLRREAGGAVATWGSTGLGVSTGHDSLASGFLNIIFNSEDKSLGTAAVAGKLNLVIDQSTHVDLLDTFTLLGDPATQARLTQPADGTTMYLPIISDVSSR